MLMDCIKLATALSVAAGATENTKDFDLSAHRKFSVLVIPSTTHTYVVNVAWGRDKAGDTNLVTDSLIASASQLNKISALTDAKADMGTIRITNSDSVTRTYDVYLYRQA